MVRNGKAWRNQTLWDEINAKLAELVDRGEIEFMPTLDGLRAQLFVEIEPDFAGDTALNLRQNTVVDEAGAPIMASLAISKSVYRRFSRKKENSVEALIRCHGKKAWDRLVARSQPLEAMNHIELLIQGT